MSEVYHQSKYLRESLGENEFFFGQELNAQYTMNFKNSYLPITNSNLNCPSISNLLCIISLEIESDSNTDVINSYF